MTFRCIVVTFALTFVCHFSAPVFGQYILSNIDLVAHGSRAPQTPDPYDIETISKVSSLQAGWAFETHEYAMATAGYSQAWATDNSLGYVTFGEPGFYLGARVRGKSQLTSTGAPLNGFLTCEFIYSADTQFFSDFASVWFPWEQQTNHLQIAAVGTLRYVFAQQYDVDDYTSDYFSANISLGNAILFNASGSLAGTKDISTTTDVLMWSGTQPSTGGPRYDFDGYYPQYGIPISPPAPTAGKGRISQTLIWGFGTLPGENILNPLDFQTSSLTVPFPDGGHPPIVPLGHIDIPVAGEFGKGNFVYVQGLVPSPTGAVSSNIAALNSNGLTGFEMLVFSSEGPKFTNLLLPQAIEPVELSIEFDGHHINLGAGAPVDFTQYGVDGVDTFSLIIPAGSCAELLQGVWGLRFQHDGLATVVVNTAQVPEPTNAVLIAGAFIGYVPLARKHPLRRSRSVVILA